MGALATAIDRIEDLLRGDDGQAWKEAQKALPALCAERDRQALSMALQVRLRFIDFLLDRFGMLNRDDIMDYFAISRPQASHDIAAYQALADGNLHYDTTDKCYRRSATYTRRFP